MESYRDSCGLKEGNSTTYLPLDMPPIVEDIMFTLEIYVLGGEILDGKTHLSEEYFNYPTPTE